MKIAILFPGYGSQFVGMGKELYDEHRIIQEYFEEAASCLDKNFVKLCFASSDAELGNMDNAYTSIYLLSCALFALLKQEGINADVVAGYNLGEYAAIASTGGITFPDGLYLLNKYANFYQDALKNMNVQAIRIKGVDSKTIEDLCFKSGANVFVAIYESPMEHVVTGEKKSIERVRDLVISHNPKAEIDYEDVAIGLHSPLMDPVIKQFKMYLEKVDFKNLSLPLIDSVDGRLIDQGIAIREQELKRIKSPVVWMRVMQALKEYDLVISIGPGTELAKQVKDLYPDKYVISINKPADIIELKKIVFKSEEKLDNSIE